MTPRAASGPPPVVRCADVARPLDEAFAVFTRQIGAWWPLPTHGLFGPDAGAVAFERGLLVERAVDGRTSVWAEVLHWDPPHRIVLAWHPGREAADASEVEVRFTASAGGGTRVELEHRGWERFGESAMLAHVALNDLAMAAVAQALVHGRTGVEFGNVTCQDPQVLADWVGETGDLTALVARGRALAEVAVAATARLDPDQLATAVLCRLFHDGALVLDEPMPWGRLAIGAQAGRHLPAHTGQLRDLRS